MIPEATLKIECNMTNPPKPIGVHVQIHGITVGVMTVHYFEQVMAQLQEIKMRAVPSKQPKRGPEYGCDSAGWPDVVGERDRGSNE